MIRVLWKVKFINVQSAPDVMMSSANKRTSSSQRMSPSQRTSPSQKKISDYFDDMVGSANKRTSLGQKKISDYFYLKGSSFAPTLTLSTEPISG